MILQILVTFIIFFLTAFVSWLTTEKWTMPHWLQYQPFSCRICQNFWLNVFAYVGIYLIYGWKITLILGLILTVLNTIAQKVDQKQKTVDINTYKLDDEK